MAVPDAPISSRKRSKDESLPALLDQIMSDFLKNNVDDCLPAVVRSFDAARNRVVVQPLIRILQTNANELARGELEVPVFQYGTEAMSLRFNLKPGGIGWIKATDRDISLFLQSLSEERPNTLRTHSFSDAVFYPDSMRGMAFTADAIMSNADGTVKTEWFSDRIVHTAPTVSIDAANANFTGNITADGDIQGVNVTGTTEVTAGTVALTAHGHSGSPTAPTGPVSPTGAPIP